MSDPVRAAISRIFNAHGNAIDAAIAEIADTGINDAAMQAKHNRQRAVAYGGYQQLPHFDSINEIWRLRELERDLAAPKKHLLRPMFDDLEAAARKGRQENDALVVLWHEAQAQLSANSRA